MISSRQFSAPGSSEHGFVLVTALVFLVVLTLVAITAMDSTTMETRMSGNVAVKAQAFTAAEGPRLALGEVLDAHVYSRGWPQSIGGDVLTSEFDLTLPGGMSILDKDGNSVPDNWYVGNDSGEVLLTASTLNTDATYQVDGNSDSDFNDGVDINTNMIVYKTAVKQAPGSSTAMVSGYEGTGKSSAGGGAFLYFELRARGFSAGASQAVLAADYRHVVRN